jgi:FeoC like transcriptional regulator.
MELKSFLVERPCASLSQIARHLAADPEAVRPMLDRWIEKGRVQRSTGARCHGCASCGEADLEFYAWVDAGPRCEAGGNAPKA